MRTAAAAIAMSSHGPPHSRSYAAGEIDDDGVRNDDYDDDPRLGRPRRPDPDTLSYLRSLPLDVTVAAAEVERWKAARENEGSDRGGDTKKDDGDDDGKASSSPLDPPQSVMAALSALDEIKMEVASLAGDEFGSSCLETLAVIGCRYSATAGRKLLRGMEGYHLHLACHRYGSHVVQTVLSLAVTRPECDLDPAWRGDDVEDEGNGDDDEESLPSLSDLVRGVTDELSPHVATMAVHVCGTHVLRTLLCVLGGLEPVAAIGSATLQDGANQRDVAIRRGRIKPKKNKKKKKKLIDGEEGGRGGGGGGNQDTAPLAPLARPADGWEPKNDPTVAEALRTLSGALSGEEDEEGGKGGKMAKEAPPLPELSPGELQGMACHPSGGPTLAVLLRVLSFLGSTSSLSSSAPSRMSEDEAKKVADRRLGIPSYPEPRYVSGTAADNFVRRLLCWGKEDDDDRDGDDDSNKNERGAGSSLSQRKSHASDVLYGLSGETYGSHLLELVFDVCPDRFHDKIVRKMDLYELTAFRDYVEHGTSNYVVQTVLRTARTTDQAEKLARCAAAAVENGADVVLRTGGGGGGGAGSGGGGKRMGILWRAAEMCAHHGVGQELLLRSIERGYGVLRSGADDGDGATELDSAAKAGGKKRRKKKAPKVSLEECVRRLLKLQPPEADGGRLHLDVAGARAVHHILHFEPRLCGDVLQGIIDGYGARELELIANDGLGSRCLLDAILDDGKTGVKPFSSAIQRLLHKLSGRWVALATQRVGHHAVVKLFRALPSMDDKSFLTAELAKETNRLSGNAMGRGVMEACAVREFLEGEEAWQNAVKRRAEREEWLKEITVDKGAGSSNTRKETEGKKRKRKRRKGQDGGNYSDDGSAGGSNSAGEVKASVVESIMTVLSVPTDAKTGGAKKKKDEKRKRKRKKKVKE